jgi:WD40 repeat protein
MVVEYRAEAPILDFDMNSSHSMIACGTELVGEDASILFWDLRSNQLLSRFTECHSDDVTQIRFHPTEANAMMSGSTDGLVCLYNLQDLTKPRPQGEDTETAEDDCLYQVIKENSVSKIGYFGPSSEYLYYITHMETFSIWRFQEAEKICNYGDVRAITPELALEYIVGCMYDADSQHLFLTAGSQRCLILI